MQTVGAAGIPARGIAARNSASYGCLQWCRQECPHLLLFAFSRYFFSFAHPQNSKYGARRCRSAGLNSFILPKSSTDRISPCRRR